MGRLAKVGRANILKAPEKLNPSPGHQQQKLLVILLRFLTNKSHPKNPDSHSVTSAVVLCLSAFGGIVLQNTR